MDQNFDVCHRLANDYFYFNFEDKRSFAYNVSNQHFILWIHLNTDDNICIEDELKTICDLSKDHDLKK